MITSVQPLEIQTKELINDCWIFGTDCKTVHIMTNESGLSQSYEIDMSVYIKWKKNPHWFNHNFFQIFILSNFYNTSLNPNVKLRK